MQIRLGGRNGVGFAARLQQAPQQVYHGGYVERLADKVGGAAGHRFHGDLQRALRGHQYDGQVGVRRAQRIHQFQAAHVGHVDIAEHRIELAGGGSFQGFAPVAHGGHAKTVKSEPGFEHQSNRALVVGD